MDDYDFLNGPTTTATLVFSNRNTILHQINLKSDSYSIQYWDSNSQPLEHESPHITTKPELAPRPKWMTVLPNMPSQNLTMNWLGNAQAVDL